MIKLVASDIDGTLLPYGQTHISQSFFEVINRLDSMGIIFVAASGRQIPSLHMLFEQVKDKIVFIAENGAYVEYKGETLHEAGMSHSLVKEIVADIKKTPGCEPIVSTKNTVYITKFADTFFRSREKEILYSTTVTDDFFNISEKVFKVTACNYDGILPNARDFAKSWEKFAYVTVSGEMYFDFMDLSVSKGNALELVMKHLGISADDCVVFGDNYNDIPMLRKTEHAFAMEHSDDTVKENARYLTENVEETIKRIYNI